MIPPAFFFDILQKNQINFFTGVPDSLLKQICAYITDHLDSKQHVIATNEGGALAIGIGHHLATNQIPLIYMQNSGLGNIINPLLSLADPEVYSIPMILMIGWRGEPNVADEPQHKKQGRVTLQLLESMEIPYQIIDSTSQNTLGITISQAVSYSKLNQKPYAILVRKNTFENYKLEKNEPFNYPLSREQAIHIIMPKIDEKSIVIATTGVTSRELFEYRKTMNQSHSQDFLTVGGMGHASQIAFGIALEKKNKSVFCLDGDGSILMHLGSLGIIGTSKLENFRHIVFNNAAHDSVGGQPTIANKIDICKIAQSLGYTNVYQAIEESEIKEAINSMNSSNSSSLLEIKVKKGFRKDLGRPTISPKLNKENLMKFIKE